MEAVLAGLRSVHEDQQNMDDECDYKRQMLEITHPTIVVSGLSQCQQWSIYINLLWMGATRHCH